MRFQFSTIFALVVTLSSCQSIAPTTVSIEPADSIPDPQTQVQQQEQAIVEQQLPSLQDVQIAVEPEPAEANGDVGVESSEVPQTDSGDVGNAISAERDLWERIRSGFRLEHHLDQPRVQAELRWFLKHPDYLDRVADRASRHLHHIVNEVESRDLPMELALLPIVESAFDPFAYSHGRASGLWQFIPGTARQYGLKINYWYDGRRDVPAATDAALNYLEALNHTFDDDWLLALAAYNSGAGNVRYSIRKNVGKGLSTHFWALGLLRETRSYVPRLLAISALVANPGKYQRTLKTLPDTPYWESVEIGSQLDLARAAELADISTEELYLLNPGFNKWSTDPEGPHRLLVPVEKAENFRLALTSLPASERLGWQRHKIQPGESLGSIASRYHTTVDTIRTANNLRGTLIRAGDSLLIPVASESGDAYDLSEEGRLKRTQAYVQRKFGAEPTRYTVKSGDSFWILSRRFGVPLRSLAKWNGMAPTDTLFPGKELVIFTSKPAQVASTPRAEGVIRKVNYRVRNGENLSLIAKKFNLKVSSIKKWNQQVGHQKYLQPGDRLTLYVDVTQAY
jgi:membrane-bound lytic murein transglycosylase D